MARTDTTTQTIDRVDRNPMSDITIEQSLMGSLLLEPNRLDDVCGIVHAGDFTDNRLATVYRRMMAMHNAGKRIDGKLLIAALKANSELDPTGEGQERPSIGFLMETTSCQATSVHAVSYAEIIRRHATAREIRRAGEELLLVANRDSLDERELINEAERQVFGIRDGRPVGVESIRTIGETLQEAMAELDSRREGKSYRGVESGFVDLDTLCSLRNGSLTILAARPSMGKTAFACNIAANVAKSGKPVLFCSLEMGAIELVDRMLAAAAKVNSRRMADGSLSNDDRSRLVEACAEIGEHPLTIDDSPSRSILEIAATARRMKRKDGLGLVVIDYLQLIEPEDSRAPREQQVARMSSRLKGLARQLDVPVLCLAQLNRKTESSKDNKPLLSHLRESGAIEQDADIVMFVHREEYFNAENHDAKGKAEIIVAKHRNGPTGNVKMVWQKEYMSFANLAASDYDNYESSFTEFNNS